MKDKVTIVSNWDGKYYGAEYVNKLYRACMRNISRPFDFILYIGPEAEKPGRLDSIDKTIRIISVGLPSWWSVLAFWQSDPPGVNTEIRLFLDLDLVIVGNLDDLLDYPSDLCCSMDWPAGSNPGRVKDANTGVSLIKGKAGGWVWDEYVRCGKPMWDLLDDKVEKSPLRMAEQGIINNSGRHVDLFPENWCTSYKYAVKKYGMPQDCRTVHFHGRPKQDEVDDGFVKECWR